MLITPDPTMWMRLKALTRERLAGMVSQVFPFLSRERTMATDIMTNTYPEFAHLTIEEMFMTLTVQASTVAKAKLQHSFQFDGPAHLLWNFVSAFV